MTNAKWLFPGAFDYRTSLLGVSLAILLCTSYWDLYQQVWRFDDQGHGPIVIAVSAWLAWRKCEVFTSLPRVQFSYVSLSWLLISLLLYVLGRSQGIVQLEAVSHISVLASMVYIWRGFAGLRVMAFPLAFLIFMVPLPGTLVQAITIPLKSAVSYVAEQVLYACGLPIARSGVTLQVGPYQLLVADACAGLNSLFTLEAVGLLYMNMVGHESRARNFLLALLIVPISFLSNVVRVIILILVTFYFGDAAGQGFVHGFAGMVLFSVALVLTFGADRLIGYFTGKRAHR